MGFDRPYPALLVVALVLAACAEPATPPPRTSPSAVSQPAILLPTRVPSAAGDTPAPRESTPRSNGDTSAWEELPVLPEVTDNVRLIYLRGLELGNNPAAFSKVGDCGSSPSWFLGVFDDGPDFYRLGDYAYLEEVIERFRGSYNRTSVAARSGFNASSVFSPLWSDPEVCEPGEGPLACEYRIHRPSFAFIMLGTNDRWHQEVFEDRLGEIVEYTLEQGIVPILATKPDNLEGDGSLNAAVARVALAYDVPLWNEWKALRPLPNHGLQEDGAHLTWEPNWFDHPVVMRAGWPNRNLTALQALDVVWRAVTGAESAGTSP